ncbi:MAG: Ig-like domain-containing protein [Patescibacteria group bacterium]|nr:Ig-like domain-containing protein [Patescibacteria group bacterium]
MFFVLNNIKIKKLFFVAAIFIAAIFIFSKTALAAVTMTPATGGSTISADTISGTYTTLTGPLVTEGVSRDIPATGTFILNAPGGFRFDTSQTVTATITRLAGTGGCFAFTSTVATPTTSTITFTMSSRDANGTRCEVSFSNVRVRPTAGTPLASGNLLNSGSNTGFPQGTNNYGTLTEVVGAKNKLMFTTSPAASSTINTDFSIKPTIKVQDQFNNVVVTDNSSIINHTTVLFDQSCGGTSGHGTLSSTPSSGSTVASGTIAYTAMQYSYGEAIKICATSTGLTSAFSNIVSISPTVLNVTASNANGTYGVGQTIAVQVVFSSAVTVSGTPQLTLSTLSPATTVVNYSSGSGTNILTFNYVVASGNSSSDLDYLSTSTLTLNGGTIKDTATGNANAVLTLASPGTAGSLAANKNIIIDTVAPATPATPDLDATDDTGTFNTDNITKQSINLTFSGTAETSSTVELFDVAVSKGTTVATGEGTYSFTITLLPGIHNMAVTATDAAGNKSATSSALAVTVDQTPPAAPSVPDLAAEDDSGISDSDNITKFTDNLTFSGTAEASSTIDIFNGAGLIGSVFATSSNWTIDLSLPAGTHEITAKATDLAGNISVASAPNLVVIIDTAFPDAPSTPDLVTADDSGVSDSDNITKFTDNLTFTGTAENEVIVELFDGAVLMGTTTVIDNAWTMDISLSAGDHSLTAIATDLAGNASSSSSPLSVTIDTTAPGVPSVPDLDNADDTGISNTDNITKQVSNNTFTGTADSGSIVEIFREKPGEYFPGGSVVATDGTWSFNMFINPGTYSLWTRASDVAGNFSATSSILTVTVDTSVSPNPSMPNLDAADDTGISNTDNITNKVSGLTFTGTVEEGSVVEIFDGLTSKGTTTASLGSYSFDLNLAAGNHNITTIATDIAGNVSTTSLALFVVIDTTAPAVPGTPNLESADDTGTSNSDNITKLTSGLTFSGTGDTGSTVELFDGATSKGSVTASSSSWTIDLALAEGIHSITAVATDLAGNISATSSPISITVDTTAPATPPTPDFDSADDTGSSNTDHITKQSSNLTILGTAETGSLIEFYLNNGLRGIYPTVAGAWIVEGSIVINGEHIFNVKAVDLAGNTSTLSGNLMVTIDTVLPTLTSTIAVPTPTNDLTPDYTFNSNEIGTINYGGTAGCGSLTNSAVVGDNLITFNTLSNGSYSCEIFVMDVAGNTSAILYVNNFTIDTATPTLSVVSSVPLITNNTTPSFTFNSSKSGTITYGGTAGCSSATTLAVNGDNTIIFNTLSPGIYSCTIKVTDLAGNQSTVLAINTFSVDPVAPTITNISSTIIDGVYNHGYVIPIQVNFSEDVIVTGLPQIILSTGVPVTTAINYVSGSGSDILTFNYEVSTGNLNSDLDYANTGALDLNSGTIKDSAGNNAILNLPTPGSAGSLGANKNLIIDSDILVIEINAPTKSSNATITNTDIRITDNEAISAANVSAASSTAGYNNFDCVQTAVNVIDCSIDIISSGNLIISATDIYDNLFTKTESGYTVDSILPETNIISSPNKTTSVVDASFSFSSNKASTFECRLDSNAFSACTSPKTYNNLSFNSHTFEVRAIDAWANVDTTPASFTWVISELRSSAIAAPASIGGGKTTVFVPFGDTKTISLVDNNGVNILLYPKSKIYWPLQNNKTSVIEDHKMEIIDLDLLNNIATLLIESSPKKINLKLNEVVKIDLNDDGVLDVSISFSNLKVNLVELTIKSLPAEKSVSSTAEVKPSSVVYDVKLMNKLKGRILLRVEKGGEAYYVYPVNGQKYYLGSPQNALATMKSLGLGATHKFITSYRVYPTRVSGRILIDVDDAGKAYYIYPKDRKAYYLGRPAQTLQVMSKLGLGITDNDLNKIIEGFPDKQ